MIGNLKTSYFIGVLAFFFYVQHISFFIDIDSGKILGTTQVYPKFGGLFSE